MKDRQTYIEGALTFTGVISRGTFTFDAFRLETGGEYPKSYLIRIGKKATLPRCNIGDTVRALAWVEGGKPNGGDFINLSLIEAEVVRLAKHADSKPAEPAKDTTAAEMAEPAEDEAMPF